MSEQINIALCCTSNYFKPAAVLIESYIRQSKRTLVFYIIYEQKSKNENIEILKQPIINTVNNLNKFKHQSHKTIFIKNNIQNIWERNFSHNNFPKVVQNNISTFSRLFLPLFLKEYDVDRCLYTDIDVIANKELTPLFEELNKIPYIGMAPDPKCDKNELTCNINNYCNAGVLLINLKALGTTEYQKLIVDVISEFQKRLIFLDQDTLNIVLENTPWKKVVNQNFNFVDQHSPAYKDAIIIHYVGKGKPWQKRGRIRPRSYTWYGFMRLNQATLSGVFEPTSKIECYKKHLNKIRWLINLRANIYKYAEKAKNKLSKISERK